MDDDVPIIPGVNILIENGAISNIGPSLIAPTDAAIVSEPATCVVTRVWSTPTTILYQTLTRAVAGAPGRAVVGYMVAWLYPIWRVFGPGEMRVYTWVGFLELALSELY